MRATARSKPAKGPRLVEARASLRTRADGTLRLVVVADTHGKPHPASSGIIAGLSPDAILHAGDIGDLAVLAVLRKLAPVLAVRGNIDAHAPDLPDVYTIDVERGDRAERDVAPGLDRAERDVLGGSGGGPPELDRAVLRLLLLHIAVYGPKLRADAARLARERGASVVVCGHSHVPFIGKDRGIVVLNAGSIGPRRFQLPIVFGVLDIGPRGVDLRHVDCETGERWEPPRLSP